MSGQSFYIITVNHKKSPLAVRNKFAFTSEQIKSLYDSFQAEKNHQFVLLSTCNRTEIYTNNNNTDLFIELFIQHSKMEREAALEHIVLLENENAIKHLFRVASGMESKILGDYEIVGQLKQAFKLSKQQHKLNGFVEKIFNAALATSKEIKNETSISNGTTSASFFTIHLLKQFLNFEEKKYTLTLLGLGKIGQSTLKNLLQHLPQLNVHIINRNNHKSIALAKTYNVSYTLFEHQQEVFQHSDILIVSSSAQEAIIFKENIQHTPIKYIFDLSIPSNVAPEIKNMKGVKIINIDELSALVDDTLKSREAELPKAFNIIEKKYQNFLDWQERRNAYTEANLSQASV